MRVLLAALTFAVSTPAFAVDAPTEEELRLQQYNYYLLENLRLTYSGEVFDYCVKKHGTAASAAAARMSRQDGYRTEIPSEAREQLRRQSLALSLYEECLDYYPTHSIARVRQCVRTRLDLKDRLNDEFAERIIYRSCDAKWRDHGYLSVDNCCSAQARYYQRYGEFRD